MKHKFLKAVNPGHAQIKEEGGVNGSLAHEWKGCPFTSTPHKMCIPWCNPTERMDSFSSRADKGFRHDPTVGAHWGLVGNSQKTYERPNQIKCQTLRLQVYLWSEQQAYCEPIPRTLRSNHDGAKEVSETQVRRGCYFHLPRDVSGSGILALDGHNSRSALVAEVC